MLNESFDLEVMSSVESAVALFRMICLVRGLYIVYAYVWYKIHMCVFRAETHFCMWETPTVSGVDVCMPRDDAAIIVVIDIRSLMGRPGGDDCVYVRVSCLLRYSMLNALMFYSPGCLVDLHESMGGHVLYVSSTLGRVVSR